MHRSIARPVAWARALGVLWVGILSACAGPRTVVVERPGEPIVVVSDLSNPPFATVDEAGIPVGFEPDLCRALAKALDRPLVFRRLPFDELLDEVVEERADFAMATMGVTEERSLRVRFSTPYYRTGIAALVRDEAGAPAGVGDLEGLRIAAGAGTTSELAVRALGLESDLVEATSKDADVDQRLLAGAIDVAVMDAPDAHDFVQSTGGSLRVMEPYLQNEDYAIAMGLDRVRLSAELERALAHLVENGTLDRLRREHGIGDPVTD